MHFSSDIIYCGGSGGDVSVVVWVLEAAVMHYSVSGDGSVDV